MQRRSDTVDLCRPLCIIETKFLYTLTSWRSERIRGYYIHCTTSVEAIMHKDQPSATSSDAHMLTDLRLDNRRGWVQFCTCLMGNTLLSIGYWMAKSGL